MFKEETLGGSQLMKHIPVTVEALRSHFEALGGRKVSDWAGWTSQGKEWRAAPQQFPQPHIASLLYPAGSGKHWPQLPWMSYGLFASVC